MTTFGQIIGSLRGGAAQDELNDKVQVLFGGAAYKVRVLLRYRAKDGLSFVVRINRRLFVEQQAFADVLDAVTLATGIKPYEAA